MYMIYMNINLDPSNIEAQVSNWVFFNLWSETLLQVHLESLICFILFLKQLLCTCINVPLNLYGIHNLRITQSHFYC